VMQVRQILILLTLYETKKALKLREVAIMLHFSKPAITRSYDRLCELGLTKRYRGSSDRRDVFIEITDKGVKLVRLLEAK
jgi:DNA-binding MarR family transcriptional regulator